LVGAIAVVATVSQAAVLVVEVLPLSGHRGTTIDMWAKLKNTNAPVVEITSITLGTPIAWLPDVFVTPDGSSIGTQINGNSETTVKIGEVQIAIDAPLGLYTGGSTSIGYELVPFEPNGSPATADFEVTVLDVVPEPGTIAAIGLGLIPMLRRRFKKS
jgi:hypothetical protein